jgi:hypothetical protein
MKKIMHKKDGWFTKCGLWPDHHSDIPAKPNATASGLWKNVTCRKCLHKRKVKLPKNKYCKTCKREY